MICISLLYCNLYGVYFVSSHGCDVDINVIVEQATSMNQSTLHDATSSGAAADVPKGVAYIQ